MRTMSIAVVGSCCILLAAGGAFAEDSFVGLVPNGAVHSCSTCHTAVPELNDFGTDFLAASNVWTPALAAMGFT